MTKFPTSATIPAVHNVVNSTADVATLLVLSRPQSDLLGNGEPAARWHVHWSRLQAIWNQKIPTQARESLGWGTCGLSRRCTGRIGSADRRSVIETTMGSGEVVVVQPGLEVLVALLGVGPMANVSPFA